MSIRTNSNNSKTTKYEHQFEVQDQQLPRRDPSYYKSTHTHDVDCVLYTNAMHTPNRSAFLWPKKTKKIKCSSNKSPSIDFSRNLEKRQNSLS